MATSKRGHNELNLEKKIDLIKASEALPNPKPRQDDLSKKFGIGRSTISDIYSGTKSLLGSLGIQSRLEMPENCEDYTNRVPQRAPVFFFLTS